MLAFEQSPEMFAQARARVVREGWANVWHVCAPAETVALPEPADAVLFNYTHDILRTPAALDNIVRQLKPGARVAIAGIKFFPWWTGPLNLLAWLKNRPYNARAGRSVASMGPHRSVLPVTAAALDHPSGHGLHRQRRASQGQAMNPSAPSADSSRARWPGATPRCARNRWRWPSR